jgi:hypothetical protein
MWIVSVFGLNARNPVLDAEFVHVAADAGTFETAVGVRITRRHSLDLAALVDRTPRRQSATWRCGGFETDAHLLFCRAADRRLTEIAFVDGSLVRSLSEPQSRIELPHRMSEMHVDMQRLRIHTGQEA